VNAWASEKELRAGSWKRAGAAGCNTKNAAGRRGYLGHAMSAARRCVYERLGTCDERGGTLRLLGALFALTPGPDHFVVPAVGRARGEFGHYAPPEGRGEM
jgi:hypothetical protein